MKPRPSAFQSRQMPQASSLREQVLSAALAMRSQSESAGMPSTLRSFFSSPCEESVCSSTR